MTEPRPLVVFVLGTSYSGTTMLDLMLGNGPDAFSCGEVHALFRPFRTSHRGLRARLEAPRPGGDDTVLSEAWRKIGPVPASRFHARVAESSRVPCVVDSSKDLSWLVDSHDWARRGGLRVANVVIWKRPEELAFSFHKRDLSLDASRHHFLTYYARLRATGVPIASLRWRDLAAGPGPLLENLCRLLGLAWFEGRERFWESRAEPILGNSGTRAQAADGLSAVRPPEGLPRDFVERFARFSAASRYAEAARPHIAYLEAADLSTGRPAPPGQPVVPKRGAWYWRARAMRAARRFLPERR